MRHITLSFLACLRFPYFSPLYHFRGKTFIERQFMSWFFLLLLSGTFLTLSRTERDIIISAYLSSREISVIRV